MSTADILRHIDTIARDKEIDRDSLYAAIEEAVAQALSKKYGLDDLEVRLNRDTGRWDFNYEVNLEAEGRILAMSVKQAIISKVREAERDVLYEEYELKLGEIVTGTVQRFEGDAVIVNLGRNVEGILPRTEKVRGEVYNIGDRIRAMVLEVKKAGPRVKIILSRSHKDMVRALFELEVPEIAEGIIEIRRIEREPGYRTKLAVHSQDDKVDCVGACVGVRGTRIKSIIDELNGERIDIIRWNNDPEALIANALKPADISHIQLDEQNKKALVLVDEDQLSLAIGRRGQNVRLASRLTGWEIDIMTQDELRKEIELEDQMIAEAEAQEAGDGEGQPAAEGQPSAEGEPAAEGVSVAGEPAAEPTNDGGGEPDAAGQTDLANAAAPDQGANLPSGGEADSATTAEAASTDPTPAEPQAADGSAASSDPSETQRNEQSGR